MENKFTQKAQNALLLAAEQAQCLGQTYIGSEHLLLGLTEERESMASKMLAKHGIIYLKIKNDILEQTELGARTTLTSKSLSPRLRKIIENASKLCQRNSQVLVGSEHLLYSLLGESDCLAVHILEKNGLVVHELQNDLLTLIGSERKFSRIKSKDEKTSLLDIYGKNLIDLAKKGHLDPTLCREKETDRVIQILSRRTKNNPCLIGEPGVGKTAVVEGLANKIADRNVPSTLQDKIIYSLDIPSLIAGAKYRGEFEDRLKGIMSECAKNDNIILFIDEIHTIIGAGSAEGAVDAANILKPALARGELQVIGATTLTEYRKYIERDSALERRFQPVNVAEPSAKDTETILFGLRQRYEEHHGLIISDEAVRAAVKLSQKHISDRFLPDKAIDLMDEAASRVRLEYSLSHKNDSPLRLKLIDLQREKEKAILKNSYQKARSIHAKEISLEQEKNVPVDPTTELMTVSAEDVARVVTDWTGIPISKLISSEAQKLLTLEDELKLRIIGQDRAISLISQSIRRARIGLKAPDRPSGSFIFVGPTGVGKTELCIALAEILFGSKNALVRLDMSEYTEKHSIARLIGAPPGYVGYGEGGILSKKLRSNPYSIVLFDEIEKAHPEIFNLMLQILEDGNLTDSQGRLISFKNALIIMTSNLGSNHRENTHPLGFSDTNSSNSSAVEREKRIKDALYLTFNPEFLNRIDEIIIFNSLSDKDIKQICQRMLTLLSQRLLEVGIKVEFDESVIELLTKNATHESMGARMLRREIRRLIENPISSHIIAEEIVNGDCVKATVNDGKIIFIK